MRMERHDMPARTQVQGDDVALACAVNSAGDRGNVPFARRRNLHQLPDVARCLSAVCCALLVHSLPMRVCSNVRQTN